MLYLYLVTAVYFLTSLKYKIFFLLFWIEMLKHQINDATDLPNCFA